VLAGTQLHELLPAADVTVLARVDDGPGAEDHARLLRPDVVVLDLEVCEPDTIRRIGRTGAAVLAFSATADDHVLVTAIRAGARGFVTGDVTARELVHTIQVLAGGSALFGAGVAGSLLSRLSGPPEDLGRLDADLTQRERQVLDLLSAGYSHGAIATRLGLAPKTIRNTVSSINAKLRDRPV
jgi:DNA-binding NarL/FixJ family response regulator